MSQSDLFLSEPEAFEEPSPPSGKADPETIRLRLVSLLEVARRSATMPWSEREQRMWQIAFPQLANWLPPDEAAGLRLAFAREMQRLARASEPSGTGAD